MKLLQYIAYAKKFAIALSAALTVAGLAAVDGTITLAEWIQIVAAFGAAFGVYQATNAGKPSL